MGEEACGSRQCAESLAVGEGSTRQSLRPVHTCLASGFRREKGIERREADAD